MSSMDPSQLERLVNEFRALLDSPPADPDGEPTIDLHTLFGELAALRSEVRLEARQFKGTLDDFRALVTVLREENDRLQRDLQQARQQVVEAQRNTERHWLLEVLELRDRIQAAAASASGYQAPGWLNRQLSRDLQFIDRIAQGLRLTQARIDRLLDRHRVRYMPAIGQPLDPHRMRVWRSAPSRGRKLLWEW